MAATPSPNFNDAALLAGEPGFISRVREAVIVYCNVVANESVTQASIALHQRRVAFASQTLGNISANPSAIAQFFAYCVASDATVLSDATVAGATPLTSGNVATQSPLATDAHISNAIAAQWNTFFVIS